MLEKKVVHMTLTDFYMSVICIFPIATALVNESVINKILFGLLIALQIGMLFDRPTKKRTVVLLLLLAISYIYSLAYTAFPIFNTNLLFYFPFYLVYTYFMCDNSSTVLYWFKKNRRFMSMILMVWTLLVGVSILLPSSYYVKEGGASYFGSFAGSIFRLGPSAMFIQALTIIMQAIHGSKKAILYHIIPMYSYFMGSSRTYLVLGLCLLVVSWYLFCNNKKTFYHSMIPLSLIVLVLLGTTSIGEKIAHTLDDSQYGDFWFRVTSSRSLLWETDMKAWNELPLLKKLLGASLNFCYEVSDKWAHNDFIEILGSFGLLGIGQYLYSIMLLFKNGKKERKMPFVISFFLVVVWLFNAFFNMHYVYFCAMLCYPFLVLTMKYYFAEIKPVEDKDKIWKINHTERYFIPKK